MKQETENTNTEQNSTEKSLSRTLIEFFKGLFSIGKIDYLSASQGIKADVSFRGLNIWILICSILVCSLGLNLNSTAVVIGAMLISPLMGPINGLGLAIGTFDRDLLRKSVLNLSVAAGVSMLTAFVFFSITPTGDDLHELFSRKTPVILDLFIAFFGGIAGILAATKRLTSNVVPGVAIATALLPPLCTAGYGLATLQMDYFLGAFYLFFMNCVMISLAALLIVVYMRFPRYSYVNERLRRKVRNGIIFFVLVFSVPSIVIYYNVIKENRENQRLSEFIEQEIESNPELYLDNYKTLETDSGTKLIVSIKGKYLDERSITELRNRFKNYRLNDYTIEVVQSGESLTNDHLEDFGQKFKVDILSDLYTQNEQKLKSKGDEIELLQRELRRISLHNLAGEKISKLVYSQFHIDRFAIDNLIYYSSGRTDTIPTALVVWKDRKSKNEEEEKLKKLLKIQLETDELILQSEISE